MKKINWKLMGCIILITFGVLFVSQGVLAVEFDPGGEIKKATELPDPEGGPPAVIIRYIQVILGFLGLMAVIMIIISGYSWMMAAGNEEKIAKAKGTLKTAIIGLVVVLLSWMLVIFIFGRVGELAS
jgi:hypothetical protein